MVMRMEQIQQRQGVVKLTNMLDVPGKVSNKWWRNRPLLSSSTQLVV
jgi:hypothetical protein